MNILLKMAIVLFLIGVVGLVVPGIPGREFLQWGVVLAVVAVILSYVFGRGRTDL